MTLTFCCNGCGLIMEYHDDRALIIRGDDKERRKDLCPSCCDSVEEYIDDLYESNFDNIDKSLHHDLKHRGRKDQK